MAYFHSKWVRNRGGVRRRPMIRLLGEEKEEMLRVAREWPEATTISMPPRGRDSYKSGVLPEIWVDADRRDILETLDSAEVDDNYLRVVSYLLRRQIYGTPNEDSERFFIREIKGNIVRLLKERSWVDQPENLGLKNLNNYIENWDLGRRSNLKFSSEPLQDDVIDKYDQDFKKTQDGDIVSRHEKDVDVAPDWNRLYRDGSKMDREQILMDRPWMRAMLVERYGEP